jgi:hypothetical protein
VYSTVIDEETTMTRYQAAMLPLFAALAKARASNQGLEAAHEVGDVVPITTHATSHQAADSAIRHARPFTLPQRWRRPDVSQEHAPMFVRIWGTLTRWSGRRDVAGAARQA